MAQKLLYNQCQWLSLLIELTLIVYSWESLQLGLLYLTNCDMHRWIHCSGVPWRLHPHVQRWSTGWRPGTWQPVQSPVYSQPLYPPTSHLLGKGSIVTVGGHDDWETHTHTHTHMFILYIQACHSARFWKGGLHLAAEQPKGEGVGGDVPLPHSVEAYECQITSKTTEYGSWGKTSLLGNVFLHSCKTI